MFFTRLMSGIVLLLMSFGFIYFGGYALIAFLLLLSLQAFFEMSRVLRFDVYSEKSGDGKEGEFRKFGPLSIIGYIAIIAYYCLIAFTSNPVILVMAVILTVILLLAAYVFAYPNISFENLSGAVFSFMYAPVMLSFVYMTRDLTFGIYIVWMIYISSWGSDTLAYCVGMLTGKTIGNHKMTPKLSPKKSIEGAIGGILGAALLAWLYGKFVMGRVVTDIPNLEWLLAVIGAAGGFFSMVGDLAASAIKRNKGIKDYGKCIPGHGGILDRFDSMIFTAPLTFFLAALLLGVF
ncbi:MAG: phosphatidate cytidylyltransferase [Lachnospiraceae bacterium]|nr:phosphatidate cytidylyltransferase [Lachnospiraceae bacterium]